MLKSQVRLFSGVQEAGKEKESTNHLGKFLVFSIFSTEKPAKTKTFLKFLESSPALDVYTEPGVICIK